MKKAILISIMLHFMLNFSCTTSTSTSLLKFVTNTLPSGITTINYNETVEVKGGRKPYSFNVAIGSLPDGLNLRHNTGEVYGTPSASGVFDFTIRISDTSASPQFVDMLFSIEIVDVIEIATTILANGSENIPYTDFVVAVGGKPPYVFSVSSGILPVGYQLNMATGEIHGTTTTTATYDFDITVIDSSFPKQMTHKSLSIEINPPFGSWDDINYGSRQPSARYNHYSHYCSIVNRLFIMFGTNGVTNYINGGYYSFVDNAWHSISTSGAPSARFNGSCILMGDPPFATNINHLMVWAGETGAGTYTNTGGMYATQTNRWGSIVASTTTQVPSARSEFVAVPLDNYEALFFGGVLQGGSLTQDAYHYSFDNVAFESKWTKTNNPPIAARRGAKGVKVGSNVYVWGGMQSGGVSNTGAIYNTSTKNWTSMTATDAPSARWNHIMMASGNKIFVWGGDDNSGNYYNDGAIYDTSNNTWTATNLGGALSKRSSAACAYNSGTSEIYIWGGWNGANYYDSGAAFKASSNTWRTMTTNSAPEGRKDHTVAWTGTQLIVFGGRNSVGTISDPKAFTP
ncbi:MAG: putative Ig domain-containing protein [Planctomycetes bacterium]|nr:putative Ig domain-containing protein [Planctomycetota bacterium]